MTFLCKVITSEVRVLHFSKRIRTGYCAGTGTRIVRTHEAPVFFFFFLMVGYGLGTAVVLVGYVYPLFLEKMEQLYIYIYIFGLMM